MFYHPTPHLWYFSFPCMLSDKTVVLESQGQTTTCFTAKEAHTIILCIPSIYLTSLGLGGNLLNTEGLDVT